jgi:hypothetical protein
MFRFFKKSSSGTVLLHTKHVTNHSWLVTQVFLLVVLTDKIKSNYTIHHRMPKYRLRLSKSMNCRPTGNWILRGKIVGSVDLIQLTQNGVSCCKHYDEPLGSVMIVSMGWDYVWELRPPTGLLFMPQVILYMSMENHSGMISTWENWFVHQSSGSPARRVI